MANCLNVMRSQNRCSSGEIAPRRWTSRVGVSRDCAATGWKGLRSIGQISTSSAYFSPQYVHRFISLGPPTCNRRRFGLSVGLGLGFVHSGLQQFAPVCRKKGVWTCSTARSPEKVTLKITTLSCTYCSTMIDPDRRADVLKQYEEVVAKVSSPEGRARLIAHGLDPEAELKKMAAHMDTYLATNAEYEKAQEQLLHTGADVADASYEVFKA